MKKITALLLALLCLLSLCACSKNETTPDSTPDTTPVNPIVYGEKYIQTQTASLPEGQQEYYIIYDNGYLEYRYYHAFQGIVTHYTLKCKYEIIDEGTLAYFVDSFVIHDDDTSTDEIDLKNDSGLLMFSKNVLSTIAGKLYVRESYLKTELPNFG